MAIFNTSAPTYQLTSVPANSATQIYNTLGPSSSGIPTGTSLQGLTVENSGPATIFLGRASSVTTAIGIPLAPGGQMTLQDTQVASSSSVWNLYAITASGSAATTVQVGLATNASVV